MSSPQHYNDGQAEPSDPTDVRSVGFDWEGLEHALGEDELGPVEYQRLAFALGRVLRWLVLPKTNGKGTRQQQRVIALRAIALAWTIDPRMFDDTPSLRSLAKRSGVTYDTLQHHSGGASDRFGVVNRYQKAHRNRNHANHPRG